MFGSLIINRQTSNVKRRTSKKVKYYNGLFMVINLFDVTCVYN